MPDFVLALIGAVKAHAWSLVIMWLAFGLLSFLLAHRSQVDAWATAHPRVAGLMKLLRSFGLDPWLLLQGLSLIIRAKLPSKPDVGPKDGDGGAGDGGAPITPQPVTTRDPAPSAYQFLALQLARARAFMWASPDGLLVKAPAGVILAFCLLLVGCAAVQKEVNKVEPEDVGKAAALGVKAASKACLLYELGVSTGHVPRDADADRECAVFYLDAPGAPASEPDPVPAPDGGVETAAGG